MVDLLGDGLARLDAAIAAGLKGRTHDVWDRAHRAGLRSARVILAELRAEATTASAVGTKAEGRSEPKSQGTDPQ